MTLKEFAVKFNGREYGSEIVGDEEKLLKENGIVMMFGESDDTLELRGAIRDEIFQYSYVETTIYFSNGKLLKNECKDNDCPYLSERRKHTKTVTTIWNGENGYPWSFETEIPHEKFSIIKDGNKYCRGILFYIDHIGGSNPTRKPIGDEQKKVAEATILEALEYASFCGLNPIDEYRVARAAVQDWAVSKNERDALMRRHSEQVEVIRKRIDNGDLLPEEKRLLQDLRFEINYDRRENDERTT
jgi:hypothetical protein